MFDRYCRTMGIEQGDPVLDAEWLRKHWVKACMRLGDDAIVRIIGKQREGRVGTIKTTRNH